jgi:hypothetical protein
MNQAEKEKLASFNEDTLLKNAVFGVFHEVLSSRGISVENYDNAQIGERYRALEEARGFIKEAMAAIGHYRKKEEKKEETNPAL